MAKILLIDTNFSSAPIEATLRNLGHEVHVVGGNPNDRLAKSSEHYWNLNYADIDALSHLIEQQGFDYLVPGCTDRSYSSCAAVNQGRFPGIESVGVDNLINNKAAFRAMALRLNLPIPQVQQADSDDLRWPLIVKPVDSFSGKGITVLREKNLDQLADAIAHACLASSSGKYLIEDYINGDLYSHSAFLKKGKVLKDFIVQENCTANEFVVDTSRVIFEPIAQMLQELRTSIEALAGELNLQDGLIHTQFIFDSKRVWLIEITRRCPGDLYSQLIELSTGYNYIENYVRPFLGMPLREPDQVESRRLIMRHTVTVTSPQSFGYLKYRHKLSIERWVSLSLVGDQLKPSPASRVGILFAQATSVSDLTTIYEMALKRELYEIAP